MDLYFLKYNNYYNRTYKRETNLLNYMNYRIGEVIECDLWNENDGIITTQTFDYQYDPVREFPDYMVAAVGTEIMSRWFIIESKRICNGQYKMTLRRDIVADRIDEILDSPAYIERALLDNNDPLIYNNENFIVNQIKTKETLIKDNTGVPWLVGYLNRNSGAITVETALDITPSITVDSLSNWTYYQYVNNYFNAYTSNSSTWMALYWWVKADQIGWIQYYDTGAWDIKENTVEYKGKKNGSKHDGYTYELSDKFPTTEEIKNAFAASSWINEIKDRLNIKTYDATNDLINLDGQYLKAGSDYYKISIVSREKEYEETINSSEVEQLPIINNICLNTLNGAILDNVPATNMFTIHSSGIQYKISLTQVFPQSKITATIPADRPHLVDAPYDMFCIPYGNYQNVGDKETAIKFITQLMSTENVGPDKNIYDVQLLPYAPKLNSTITPIKKDSTIIGNIYYSTESSFSKTVLLREPISALNKKIENICDKYRLVSPNYSGQFEFTAAANNGISGFTINCTYMPINPYIRIAPIFGGLYGTEFNDARGLICGGDFSLPVANSSWVSYQQNNKNYQNIFDRQITNMEFTNDINRMMEKFNMITGTAQGTATGAAAGASVGGGYGAIAGAIVGGGASALGGLMDLQINESIRAEQMNFTKDQFRMSLASIQAQPYSLSKTTAFTANNKIFPILEYYTCTDREKEALAEKISQVSMNVGVNGTLREYINKTWSYKDIKARNFIKCKILKNDVIKDDFHNLSTLNQELEGGIYFNEYTV